MRSGAGAAIRGWRRVLFEAMCFDATMDTRSILALHYHYAVLLVSSPLLYRDAANAWSTLAQDGQGYEQMERARDAAIELIRAICSVSSSPRSSHRNRA